VTVKERLEQVEERIARALARAGRRREEITLIAVSKTFPAAAIREAYEAGLRDFGENYVQEFEAKRPELADLTGARFHLIGHLQSNKARRAAELFDSIQTVDTMKLARRLNEHGRRWR
jgi:pyridoxal phosphate enzyme (YggS family)